MGLWERKQKNVGENASVITRAEAEAHLEGVDEE